MPRTITYNDILTICGQAGLLGTGGAGGGTTTTVVNFTATYVIPLESYQKAVLALDLKEFQDQQFTSTVAAQPAGASQIQNILGIDSSGINKNIPDASSGDILINADRVVINSKKDFSMIFGQQGVALASPERVNIDCSKPMTLFAHEQLFLGVPNKGQPPVKQKEPGKTKGHPTKDDLYDPMVLGIKLANLLEDLLFILKSADLVSGVSPVKFEPYTQAEFGLLANRIPEMLSTYGYIDGLSHAEIDQKQLKLLKEAQKKVKDYVPPKELTGTVVGGVNSPGGISYTQPLTNPYKDIPGYYNTPEGDLYTT